jgi:hypothetical protein
LPILVGSNRNALTDKSSVAMPSFVVQMPTLSVPSTYARPPRLRLAATDTRVPKAKTRMKAGIGLPTSSVLPESALSTTTP